MPLDDTERKVLRIVANIVQSRGRPPTIQEIAKKAGRSSVAVRRALLVLDERGYISWQPDRHDQLQVVKAWEDHHWMWLSYKK